MDYEYTIHTFRVARIDLAYMHAPQTARFENE